MQLERHFILTEAAAMVPLVRRILVDVREARARIARLRRERQDAELTKPDLARWRRRWRHWGRRLANCVDEACSLGVRITPGIRCEALFPFEHQWIGPAGDGKIRPAFFVYNDANPTIEEWIFAGWPNDRRTVCADWWKVNRPSPNRAQAA